MVAQVDRYDLRLKGAPDPFGLGEDVVYLLIGGVDAECEIARCAVKPLVHELPNDWVVWRGIEVTG